MGLASPDCLPSLMIGDNKMVEKRKIKNTTEK
jgi:hypothetical protein